MSVTMKIAGAEAVTVVDGDTIEWAKRWKWRLFGKGYVGRGIYVPATGKYTVGYLHRLITGCPRGLTVDHINGDPLDNRRANLRIATQEQQNQNQRRPRRSRTGHRNVYEVDCGGVPVFVVKLNLAGRYTPIGRFSSLNEAVAAAEDARRRLMTHSPENSLVFRSTP